MSDLRPLGRVKEHDPRSRAFAFPAGDVSTLRSVTWARHAPVFDQGNLGSCTGNACAGALATGPLYDTLQYLSSLPPLDEAFAVKLYSTATQLDDIAGAYPPDDTGSSGLAVAKAAQQAGYLSGYQHAFDFNAALTALAAGPVIVGVNWYSSFDTPTAAGELAIAADATVRGGHEFVLDTLDVEHLKVWMTNSWGTSWGQSGRAWLSFYTLKRLLSEEGDCTILTPVTAPTPIPGPTPTPVTPDGCLWATLRPFASGARTYIRRLDRAALNTWAQAKGFTTTERTATMDWNSVWYVARDYVAAFLSAFLGVLAVTGGNPLDWTPDTLHKALGAGLAALILIALNWANSCNKAYGRGAK